MDSAQRVAAAQITVVHQHLGAVADPADVEPALIAFGRALATQDAAFTQHFALVRQIHAELGHVPADAVQAWQDAGPRRVHTELATHLRRIADRGLLAVDNADIATEQLVALATTSVTQRRLFGPSPSTREVHRLADAGIHTFLHGHLRST